MHASTPARRGCDSRDAVPAGRSDRKASPTGRPHASSDRHNFVLNQYCAPNRAGFRPAIAPGAIAGRSFTFHHAYSYPFDNIGTRVAITPGRKASRTSTQHTDRSPPALCKLERHTLSIIVVFYEPLCGSQFSTLKNGKLWTVAPVEDTSSNGAKTPECRSPMFAVLRAKATRKCMQGDLRKLWPSYTAYIAFRATVSALT